MEIWALVIHLLGAGFVAAAPALYVLGPLSLAIMTVLMLVGGVAATKSAK